MTTHAVLGTERIPRERRHPLVRLLLGDRTDPVWARPTLWGLLVVTAILYLWNLSASGYANTFYAAAVQAGSKNWEALLFGSLDSSNFITVDKPPASIWVMALSARLFGFSSWSVLAPEALMGVASVALLFGTVRRSLVSFGARAATIGGLVAGLVMAFTPAAALMFRFDNPDALLVLLMTAAAYFVVRALPKAAWKWLLAAGIALGFAFLTKMLQGLLVLPAFGLVYLIAAPTLWWKRIVHLLIAAGGLVVSAGWFVVLVALWPASTRPYIGGSTNNSVLDLAFGYNGLGRIFGGTGQGGGAGGGGTSGSSFGGATGLQRLFSSEMGLEISWLLPVALLALVLGLIATWRRPRTDLLRAGFIALGGWLVVTALVFSYMSGVIHPYYAVALAPAIGGLVGLGGVTMWKLRDRWLGRAGMAAMFVLAGMWAVALLNENSSFVPWLRWVILAGSVFSAATFLVGSTVNLKRVTAVALIAGSLFGIAGTASYSIATASVSHSGSIPTVGPSSQATGFGGGDTGGPGGGTAPARAVSTTSTTSATASGSTSIESLLTSSKARWAAAINGSQSAATLELSTGTAIMAIGGWSDDPAPTLAQFEAYVKAGDIGFYISGGQGGGGFGGQGTSVSSQIASWVSSHYTATTVGSYTVYKLTK
jgi:4-amino-4-deoxy-L-arabinose transferase-like glycosyltransferase